MYAAHFKLTGVEIRRMVDTFNTNLMVTYRSILVTPASAQVSPCSRRQKQTGYALFSPMPRSNQVHAPLAMVSKTQSNCTPLTFLA